MVLRGVLEVDVVSMTLDTDRAFVGLEQDTAAGEAGRGKVRVGVRHH